MDTSHDINVTNPLCGLTPLSMDMEMVARSGVCSTAKDGSDPSPSTLIDADGDADGDGDGDINRLDEVRDGDPSEQHLG